MTDDARELQQLANTISLSFIATDEDDFLSAAHAIKKVDEQKLAPTEECWGGPIPKTTLLAQRAAKSPNLLCFIEQFPLAMAAIAECHDYARGPLAKGDYRPSLLRHLFNIGEHPDHDAAVAWNAMAQLEIKLRQRA